VCVRALLLITPLILFTALHLGSPIPSGSSSIDWGVWIRLHGLIWPGATLHAQIHGHAPLNMAARFPSRERLRLGAMLRDAQQLGYGADVAVRLKCSVVGRGAREACGAEPRRVERGAALVVHAMRDETNTFHMLWSEWRLQRSRAVTVHRAAALSSSTHNKRSLPDRMLMLPRPHGKL
jgi:hypothetical protein